MPSTSVDARQVSLTVPAQPEYLVLARLALSAVCRLTPLAPDEIVDLKLAVTEAATGVLTEAAAPEEQEDRIAFAFVLEEDRLTLEVRGALHPVVSIEEHDLSRAIIDATVDEAHYGEGRTELVKYLSSDQG